MTVLKRFVDCFIKITKIYFIGSESRNGGRDFVKLASKVLTLLIRSLGSRREGG